MQVAIKPAKPFAFGVLDGSATPVFGLPGNPVSAMVSFELLVRPAVRRMAGHRSLEHPVVPAAVTTGLHRKPDGKTHFVRAVTSLDGSGRWSVQPTSGQDSHHLLAMADANSLAVLPDGHGVEAGALVDVILTDPDRLVAESSPRGVRSMVTHGARRDLRLDRRTADLIPGRCPPRGRWSIPTAGSTTTCASR